MDGLFDYLGHPGYHFVEVRVDELTNREENEGFREMHHRGCLREDRRRESGEFLLNREDLPFGVLSE